MGSAHKVDQAAKATSDIRTLIGTARSRLESGFAGINAFDVLVEPAVAEVQLREAFEALASAYSILVHTAWPDRDDHKDAARRNG